jgi:hypothetical protein
MNKETTLKKAAKSITLWIYLKKGKPQFVSLKRKQAKDVMENWKHGDKWIGSAQANSLNPNWNPKDYKLIKTICLEKSITFA